MALSHLSFLGYNFGEGLFTFLYFVTRPGGHSNLGWLAGPHPPNAEVLGGHGVDHSLPRPANVEHELIGDRWNELVVVLRELG